MEGELNQQPKVLLEAPKTTASQNIELWDFLKTVEVPKEPRVDAAFAFGQGPVQDVLTKKKAEEVAKALGTNIDDEINSWGKGTAIAMGYLYSKGEFREAFFSGGATGGGVYKSEADHMKRVMEEVFGPIPHDYSHLEDRSTNTLSNFENTLNVIDQLTSEAEKIGQKRDFKTFALVCSKFHGPRIKTLAALYNIYDTTIFSSESVLEVMAHDPTVEDKTIDKAADTLLPKRDRTISGRKAILDWLDERTDPLRVGLNRTREGDYQSFVGRRGKPYTHYEKQEGQESVDIMNRARNEDMFTEGLLTMPANWLGFIADIQSPQRFEGILNNIREWNQGFLEELGVKPQDNLDQIREKLRPYKSAPARQFVSLDWKPYEQKTVDAVSSILDRIRSKQEV